MTLNRLREIRDELFSAATELSQRLSSSDNRPNVRNVIYTLERTPCDAEALWLLRNRNVTPRTRIDSYWSNKHDYLKQKLVEKIANRLHEAQIPVEVTVESQDFTVREDILITIKGRDIVSKRKLALEIKTGLEVSIQQLERLMYENDIVVLVRAVTGHVAVLHSCQYAGFLIESLSEKARRARRLTQDHIFNVPGRHCQECSNKSCSHARAVRTGRLATLRDEDFQSDLDLFLRTLPSTMEKATDYVIQELMSGAPLARSTDA